MMTSSSREGVELSLLSKVVLEGLGGEGRAIVREVAGYNNATIKSYLFKLLDCIDGLMGTQTALELNVNEACGCINKNATS